MKKLAKWLNATFLVVLLGAYACWFFTVPALTVASAAASTLCCALVGLLGLAAISALLNSWHGQVEVELDAALGRRSLRLGNRHPILKLLLWLLIARLAVYALAYILYTTQQGYQGGLLDTFPLWQKGDAASFLGIAENWYTAENDPRLSILLFPFYPILVRIVNLLLQNVFASGMLVSLVCTLFSGVLLYELAMLDMDRTAALRAVKFQMLLPAAFLLAAPANESLFLLLSIACMLQARKKQYLAACLLGGLASFTHILGVLLLVPLLAELVGDAIRTKMEGRKPWRYLGARLFALLLLPAGLLLYIYIHSRATGGAFPFPGNQSGLLGTGVFFQTAASHMDSFLNNIIMDQPQAFGLWLPNLLYLFGAPFCLLLSEQPRKFRAEKKEPTAGGEIASAVPRFEPLRQPYTFRASYICYFLVYYCVSVGMATLLPASRTLTCCFPLALALASRERPRWLILLLYIVFAALQFAYLFAYVSGWPVTGAPVS